MRIAIMIAFILVSVAPAFGQDSAAARQFVGTWKLVRIEVHERDGSVTPDASMGSHPIGYIMYDDTGHMAVQIMNPDRKPLAGRTIPTGSEASAAVGYTAYAGRYEVHQKEGYVMHLVEMSIMGKTPGQARRDYSFEGDRLELTVPAAGDGARTTVTWERIQ